MNVDVIRALRAESAAPHASPDSNRALLVTARDFLVVQQLYPNVQVELTRAQFVCWRVPAQ
ncbi:MAG TPA: hypothetical protein VIU85_04775 [Chthoniobacterales bacterium]